MNAEDLYKFLVNEGYHLVREVPGRGFCGIQRMLYTWGLFYGLTEHGYKGRYCYHGYHEAAIDGIYWSGNDDPPGDWIKHKGERGEYPNPNNLDQRTATA